MIITNENIKPTVIIKVGNDELFVVDGDQFLGLASGEGVHRNRPDQLIADLAANDHLDTGFFIHLDVFNLIESSAAAVDGVGVDKTITALTDMVSQLEDSAEPVVLVLFGDHKPWAGNGNSAYLAAGVNFDFSTLEGFANYYTTPYLIWANSAAQKQLGSDVTGAGGDFSPCCLMTEVFDRCGWEGPGFMQLAREIRDISPLVHVRNLYLWDNVLTDTLPQLEQEKVTAFLSAQYDREHGL